MWSVIVPTNRPEKFKEFYKAWETLFIEHSVHLVVVEDAEKRSDLGVELSDFTHLCWADVPDFIPRKTDMIRSWGFYKVWQECNQPGVWDFDHYILTLDDDVLPDDDPFLQYEIGFALGVFSDYLSVGALTNSNLQMRGFPYKDRKFAEVGVQYGGWNGVLDYDAATQLALPQPASKFRDILMPIPKGVPTTCCIMNTAFHVKYVPILWQLTMLDGRYNRIGDIWSGLFIKKTLDALGVVMLINGKASVTHNRASDPYNSLMKEAPSVWLNDNIWENLATPTSTNMLNAYEEVISSATEFFKKHDLDYAKKFAKDFASWLKLFKP